MYVVVRGAVGLHLDPAVAVGVEHVEADALRLRGQVQLDRDRDQPELDGALPHRTRHSDRTSHARPFSVGPRSASIARPIVVSVVRARSRAGARPLASDRAAAPSRPALNRRAGAPPPPPSRRARMPSRSLSRPGVDVLGARADRRQGQLEGAQRLQLLAHAVERRRRSRPRPLRRRGRGASAGPAAGPAGPRPPAWPHPAPPGPRRSRRRRRGRRTGRCPPGRGPGVKTTRATAASRFDLASRSSSRMARPDT